MRLLWDTHTYLWFSEASIEISDKLKDILLDDNTENYLSIISIW
jgi:PIN domain nuclease of toxin-antitoxin system